MADIDVNTNPHIDISTITDKETVRALLKYDYKLYKYINSTLKQDISFMKLIIEDNPEVTLTYENTSNPRELLMHVYRVLSRKYEKPNVLAEIIYNNSMYYYNTCDVKLAVAAVNAGVWTGLILRHWPNNVEIKKAMKKMDEILELRYNLEELEDSMGIRSMTCLSECSQ